MTSAEIIFYLVAPLCVGLVLWHQQRQDNKTDSRHMALLTEITGLRNEITNLREQQIAGLSSEQTETARKLDIVIERQAKIGQQVVDEGKHHDEKLADLRHYIGNVSKKAAELAADAERRSDAADHRLQVQIDQIRSAA